MERESRGGDEERMFFLINVSNDLDDEQRLTSTISCDEQREWRSPGHGWPSSIPHTTLNRSPARLFSGLPPCSDVPFLPSTDTAELSPSQRTMVLARLCSTLQTSSTTMPTLINPLSPLQASGMSFFFLLSNFSFHPGTRETRQSLSFLPLSLSLPSQMQQTPPRHGHCHKTLTHRH